MSRERADANAAKMWDLYPNSESMLWAMRSDDGKERIMAEVPAEAVHVACKHRMDRMDQLPKSWRELVHKSSTPHVVLNDMYAHLKGRNSKKKLKLSPKAIDSIANVDTRILQESIDI